MINYKSPLCPCLRSVAAVLLISLVGPPPGFGQQFLPGPLAAGGGICHHTERGPNDTRVDLGPGEIVNLEIESWYDEDIYVDDLGMEYPVQDSLGVVEWCLTGPGHLEANVGTQTEYVAHFPSQNYYGASVTVVVHDSGAMGLDPANTDEVFFNILVPTSAKVLHYNNVDIDATLGPPNLYMAGDAYFVYQILPDTVNFYQLQIHEVIPYTHYPWPNKNKPEFEVPAQTADAYPDDGASGEPNLIADQIATPFYESLSLWNVDKQEFESRDFAVYQTIKFHTDDLLYPDGWVTFATGTHSHEFSSENFKTKLGVFFGGVGGYADPQGPFKDTGK